MQTHAQVDLHERKANSQVVWAGEGQNQQWSNKGKQIQNGQRQIFQNPKQKQGPQKQETQNVKVR